jgi:peptidoglycan hydrolase-like protein with peptidoglycan-binding domain
MHVFTGSTSELHGWIRKEVEFERDLNVGDRGMAVKRVQEWLSLHNLGVPVDGAFGPATRIAVERFQTTLGLPPSGIVDHATFERLVEPMVSVLRRASNGGRNLPDMILTYGRTHLKAHPMEVGGQNRGPWVRLYMKGNEGPDWAWCAGFVCFLMDQAAQTLGQNTPIKGSFSCDSVAAQAREADRFRSEQQAKQQGVPAGSFFLVRRTSTDWIHTGLVVDAAKDAFDTLEGNTNDEGSREGFEVCARSRGYDEKDFVLLG